MVQTPPVKAAGSPIPVLAGADRLPAEPGAGAGGRDAVELLARVHAVLGAEVCFPRGFGRRRPGRSGALADAAEEALRQRLLQGHAMQRAGLRAVADIAAEGGEGVGLAVVGADDVRPLAPDAEGQYGLQHLGEIVDEGRLVDDGEVAGPAAGAEGARRARHGEYLVARGEREAEGADAARAVGDQDLAQSAGVDLQCSRPNGAVLDEAARHLQVVGLVVDIAAAEGARVHHRVIGRRPGDADTARLLDRLESRPVSHPARLIGEEGGG